MEQSNLKVVKEEDTPEFARIYDTYAEKLYAFIYYKTCHRETAEDLTSRTFLKALEKWDTYNPEKGAVSTWLYCIARNTVCDHYRRKKATVNIEDVWDLAEEEDITGEIHRQTQWQEISKMMKTLSPGEREILIMRIWQDMSYKEISGVMDKSEGACKMLFSRTLSKLKSRFATGMLLSFFLFKLIDTGGWR